MAKTGMQINLDKIVEETEKLQLLLGKNDL